MVESLIDRLIELNINVELEGEDHVKIYADPQAMTPALLEELKNNKTGLIQYLKENNYSPDDTRIPTCKPQESYPLSPAQRRLWLLSRFTESNAAYNIPSQLVFANKLDYAAISHCYHALIERHEILRTIFIENEQGDVRQYIKNPGEIEFYVELKDLRKEPEQNKLFQEAIRCDASQPFDLATGPLIRATVYQLDNNRWIFSYVMHHIISDAWSMEVLMKELVQLYQTFKYGAGIVLAPLRIQYRDYAVWQQGQLQGQAFEKHKRYWLDRFAGELPVLDLVPDKPRPPLRSYGGAFVNRPLNASTATGFKNFCNQHGATIFIGALAAVNALFYKYTGQEDIIIGCPATNREHPDLENQVGFYVSLLPLRIKFCGDHSFSNLLSIARQTTLEAYQHQHYPFDELVDELKLRRDLSRTPLFDVLVEAQSAFVEEDTTCFASIDQSGYSGERLVKFDLRFLFIDTGKGIDLVIEYNTDIYERDTIDRVFTHLEATMVRLVTDPGLPLAKLDYLSAAERQQVLEEFNDTTIPYSKDKTLVDLFEEQTAKTPGNIAVTFEDRHITYQQLDQLSNKLAHHLQDHFDIQPDTPVGIMTDRSHWMIVAILGVLKAGGAYVPIEPSYPDVRRQYIIDDTALKVLLVQPEYIKEIKNYAGVLLELDDQLEKLENPTLPLRRRPSPRDLAYVIYTSGSTGQPKGVMVEHAGVVNMVLNHIDFLPLQPGLRFLQFASFAFDGSCQEIFNALSSGCELIMIRKEVALSPLMLGDLVRNSQFDIATLPPSYQKVLEDNLPRIRIIYSAGEPLQAMTARKIQAGNIRLINGYGPTENSVTATLSDDPLNERGRVTIGKPIGNVAIYILDEEQAPVPVKVPGEICIGGAGLARGYLNQPGLTAEKFIPHPFKKGERLYKTGDRGRWLPDGTIEFLGRKDEQVKVRGYRIEPAEIEACLHKHPFIESAVTIPKPNREGEVELVAYIVCRKEIQEPLSSLMLREYLSKHLPAYMIPAYFVRLESLPVNSSSKIDKRLLPDPNGRTLAIGTEYVAPKNEMESRLVNIWSEILDIDENKAGINDDFFAAGGSSLKAMKMIKRIRQEMRVMIPVPVFFQLTTIQKLGEYIDTNLVNTDPVFPIDITAKGDMEDISFNQLRYFIGQEADKRHIVISHYDYEDLEIDLFAAAVKDFVIRHESFRTRFVRIDGVWKQVVLSPGEVVIETSPIIEVGREEQIRQENERLHNKKFDVDAYPLFEIQVFKVKNGRYHVLLLMHHIIYDGYSEGIIRRELPELYRARCQGTVPALAQLSFQYSDYTRWQKKFLESAHGKRHKDYWLKKLDGFHPEIANLQVDRNISSGHSNVIGSTIQIHGELLKDIDSFCRENSSTRAVVLKSTLLLMFNRLSGQDDITIFTQVSGRNSPYSEELDWSGVMGDFTNLLLMRNHIDKDRSLSAFVKGVQREYLEDLDHETYPFARLVNEIPGVDISTFFNSTVLFNYHNYDYLTSLDRVGEDAEQESHRPGDEDIHQAFILFVLEYKNSLQLHLVFNEFIFGHTQRAKIKSIYMSILAQIIYRPAMGVKEISETFSVSAKT
jgi:amino acid adenylation domain-containing protein